MRRWTASHEEGALTTHSFPMFGLFAGLSEALSIQLVVFSASRRPTAVTGHVVGCAAGDGCEAISGGGASIVPTFGPTTSAGDPEIVFSSGGREFSGRALPGAVVSAIPLALPPAQRGHLTSGQVVSIADGEGRYALALPLNVNASFVMRAIHPAYQTVATAPGHLSDITGIGGAVSAHIAFITATPIDPVRRGPVLSASHNPNRPQVYTGAGGQPPTPQQRAAVRIIARAPSGADSPPVFGAVSVTAVPLVSGDTIAANDIVVSELESTASPGDNTTIGTLTVTAPRPALVRLRISASANEQNGEFVYPIYFGGAPPPPSTEESVAEPDDHTGPRVSRTWPLDRASNAAIDAPIEIVFNEQVRRSSVETPNAITLRGVDIGDPTDVTVSLNEDGHSVRVTHGGLLPDHTYQLSVFSAVTDLAGNVFHQDPTSDGSSSFTLTFRTTTQIVSGQRLVDTSFSTGAIVSGSYVFVADALGGSIKVYRLADVLNSRGGSVTPTSTYFLLGGFPRSMALVPSYSFYRLSFGSEECQSGEEGRSVVVGNLNMSGCIARNRNLLAVTGGQVTVLSENEEGQVSGSEQYLTILDVSDPQHIGLVTRSPITPNIFSTTGRLKWSAPYLAYLEHTFQGSPSVSMVNLQSFIIGHDLTATQLGQLPLFDRPGVDLNHDGDYVDAGETLPLPGAQMLNFYAGRERIATLFESDQEIRDYGFDGPSLFVGAGLSSGQLTNPAVPLSNPNHFTPLPPMYQTLSVGSANTTELPRDQAGVPFAAAQNVDAVIYLPQARLHTPAGDELHDLVLVSANFSDGQFVFSRLFAIDVHNPLDPQIIGSINGIPLPAEIGQIRSFDVDPFSTGTVRAFGVEDAVLIDIASLGTTYSGTGLHPAIRGVTDGGGSASLAPGSSDFGVDIHADTTGVTFSGPQFSFVSFPGEPALVRAQAFVSAAPDEQRRLLQSMQTDEYLRLARYRAAAGVGSDITPANPAAHHYVLLRAPGWSASASGTINLLVESTNEAGYPIADACDGNVPTRGASQRVLDEQGITSSQVRPLVARRLSSDTTSPYYNLFLSDPFVLVYERMSADEIASVRDVANAPTRREVYRSATGLRVSIDPSIGSNNILTNFASEVQDHEIQVGSAGRAKTLLVHRALGPNPAPITGSIKAPGTSGMVSVHNAAFDVQTEDLSVRSVLPISFVRSYRGQDQLNGPFGPGWDFNYNQRLVLVGDELVPLGMHLPLVVRGEGHDTTANGGVGLIRFRGHFTKGGYDVQDDGNEEGDEASPELHRRVQGGRCPTRA